ncbi:hypothetical protein PCE1_000299 [Barthelona sp. PCE]
MKGLTTDQKLDLIISKLETLELRLNSLESRISKQSPEKMMLGAMASGYQNLAASLNDKARSFSKGVSNFANSAYNTNNVQFQAIPQSSLSQNTTTIPSPSSTPPLAGTKTVDNVKFDARLIADACSHGYSQEDVEATLLKMYRKGSSCSDLRELLESLRNVPLNIPVPKITAAPKTEMRQTTNPSPFGYPAVF